LTLARTATASIIIGALSAAHAVTSPADYQSTGRSQPTESADTSLRERMASYGKAWFEGNAAQMLPLLHPAFVGHITVRKAKQPDTLESVTGLALLDLVDRGIARTTPADRRRVDVEQLQVREGLASAMVQWGDRQERQLWVLWNNDWRLLHASSERTDRGAP
jgi:hypothetical protein